MKGRKYNTPFWLDAYWIVKGCVFLLMCPFLILLSFFIPGSVIRFVEGMYDELTTHMDKYRIKRGDE